MQKTVNTSVFCKYTQPEPIYLLKTAIAASNLAFRTKSADFTKIKISLIF